MKKILFFLIIIFTSIFFSQTGGFQQTSGVNLELHDIYMINESTYPNKLLMDSLTDAPLLWKFPNGYNYHKDEGTEGNDMQFYYGTDSNDWVDQYGYGGDDMQLIDGGYGHDIMRQFGGDGFDALEISGCAGNDRVVQFSGNGDDILQAFGGDENDLIFQQGDDENDELIILGGIGNDILYQIGGDGNDIFTVDGGENNDIIDMWGGNGDDTSDYTVSAGADSAVINGGSITGESNAAIIRAMSSQNFIIKDGNGNILHNHGSGGTVIILINIQNYNVIVVPAGTSTSDILNNKNNIPNDYILYQNYPNPFNSVTSIKFKVTNEGKQVTSDKVVLRVFDLMGREVRTLVDERLEAGMYEVRFDSGDLPSGVYFYRMEAGDYVETRKMILMK